MTIDKTRGPKKTFSSERPKAAVAKAKPVMKKVQAPATAEVKKTAPRCQTIYVGNLNYNMNEHDVKYMFFNYGRVISATLIKNEHGHSKGIAFVEISGRDEAQKAIAALNGKIVLGRTLKVSIAKPNEFHMFKDVAPKKKAAAASEEKRPIISKRAKLANSGLALLQKNLKKSAAAKAKK